MRTAKSIFQDSAFFNEGNDSGEGSMPASGPALLANVLAWAAKRRIPFVKVIPALTDYGVPGWAAIGAKKWNKGLWRVHARLLAGEPLHKALERSLSWALPKYFLLAVEKAEKEGTLERTLPHFARSLSFNEEIARIYTLTLFPQFLSFSMILFFALPLALFIVPKFLKIMAELGTGESLSWLAIYFDKTSGFLFSFDGLLLALGIFATVFAARLFRRELALVLEELCVRIPLLGSVMMDKALLELSGSMSSYLEDGRDVKEALAFSCEASSHPWLKIRLRRCLREIEKGESWLDAWAEMRLGLPLDEMILRNAAAKEDPASGFGTLMEWHHQKALRLSKRIAILLFIAALAVNATIVSLIAWALFGSLVRIIEGVMVY